MAQWKEYEVRVTKKVGKHEELDHVEGFDTFDEAYKRQLELLEQGTNCDVVHS